MTDEHSDMDPDKQPDPQQLPPATPDDATPDEATPDEAATVMADVAAQIGAVIVGQLELVRTLLVCLLAEGHALVEGVPGLGKTELVKALGVATGLDVRRVQFTADLMPADVTGTQVIEQSSGGGRSFVFRPGPVFTNLLLADEINRATPKTQAALLEAMAERTVTVAGETRQLARPFLVMATQNPVEMEGTYPLPEAQLDRFLVKAVVPYPSDAELHAILERTTGTVPASAKAVTSAAQLRSLIRLTRDVPVPSHVSAHAVALVRATLPESDGAPTVVKEFVRFGSSPRGAQGLVLVAKAMALLDGRPSASLADVRSAAPMVLGHRCVLSFAATSRGVTGNDVIADVLQAVSSSGETPRG